jgi:hypothetical protein
MGGAVSIFQSKEKEKGNDAELKIENDKDLEEKDDRRRNSLAFYISQFVTYEGEDFAPLVEVIMKDKYPKTGGKPPTVRHSKFSRIADSIMQGNIKELRNQLFVYFKNINRHYKDHHHNFTLLHMICQEGYYSMLDAFFNPANRSDLDADIDIDVNVFNDKKRTPLFLCFTPPCATTMGLQCGLDSEGNIDAKKRIEYLSQVLSDSSSSVTSGLSRDPTDLAATLTSKWVKPGGPKSRENCIKLLLSQGANVNAKDFQGFTALHFAAMWGWTSTVKLLLNHGAEANAVTDAGRTALMLALDLSHDDTIVTYLAASTTIDKFNILVDKADPDGFTPLMLGLSRDIPISVETLTYLIEQGSADVNHVSLRKKTALQIACARQLIEHVYVLLDHHVKRDVAAFALLKDSEDCNAATLIQQRLIYDEKVAAEAAVTREREMLVQLQQSLKERQDAGRLRKLPGVAWVEYLDKKSKKPFYYNSVTRQTTFDKPKEFKPDKNRIITEQHFGLHFYH